MPLLQSLKTRLIVMAALWILVGIISAGFVLSAVFRHHVTAQFKEELYVHLSELERLADLKDGKAVLTRPLSDPRYDEVLSGFYWEIQRGDAVLARSASMQGPMLRTPIDEPKDVGVHTHLTEGPTGPILVAEQGRWQTPIWTCGALHYWDRSAPPRYGAGRVQPDAWNLSSNLRRGLDPGRGLAHRLCTAARSTSFVKLWDT